MAIFNNVDLFSPVFLRNSSTLRNNREGKITLSRFSSSYDSSVFSSNAMGIKLAFLAWPRRLCASPFLEKPLRVI